MPDNRYEEASRQIELFLKQLNGVRQLNPGEVSFYGNHFAQGWEILGLCEVSKFKLHLLLPSAAPYSPLRVAVCPAPHLLEWPHLEEKGLLCLLSETSTYSIYDCARVAQDLIEHAIKLVSDSVSGANISHFEDEFQSYWKRWEWVKDNLMHIHCLPEGPSRWVSSWHSKGGCRVADNEMELLKWMENRYGQEGCSKVSPQKIPFLWLPRALRPKEYPKNVHMLRSTLKELDVDDSMLRSLLIDDQLKYKSVVLGFKSRQGTGFAGLFVGNPTAPLTVGGFKKRPPENIILMRYNGTRIDGARAIRLDSPWIHGRDRNPQERVLSIKSALIFGIGSIGSFVVELLAMSGVGELILVDPEVLSPENASRHVLGVNSIGKNKAEKLAKDLNARFPHLKISGYDMTCEDFLKTILPSIQEQPDVIISTIGSWGSEGFLNAMTQDSVVSSPCLYGWTEPYAAAGHAVVFYKGQGCLRCMRDDMGRPKMPVTSWPKRGTLLPVPACGGYFQPYGAVEISHIHGLIVDLVLDLLLGNTKTSTHKVWIGSKRITENMEGTWNTSWIDRYGEIGRGGGLRDIEVTPDPDCPECGRQT